MKKILLVVLVILAVLAFVSGCAKPEPLNTTLGDFDFEQIFAPTLGEETAAQGNIYLVVYLTPVEGTQVLLDDAQDYFYSGVKARVSDLEYDMSFLAYEKIDGNFLRFGLVFEVIDNNYENAKSLPDVTLILP